jgi:hypothetical protein
VIVGSDNQDIFSTLTGHYERSFFSFEPHSLEEFSYEVVYYAQPSSHRSSSIASQNNDPNLVSEYNTRDEYTPHGQKQFQRRFFSNEGYSEEGSLPPQRGFSTDLGESASIGFGGQLFEEKAVILASHDDYLSSSKAPLLEGEDEDDGFRHNMNGNGNKSNTSEERYLDEQYEEWSDEQSKNNRMMISQPGNKGVQSQQLQQQQQQQEANDNKSEYDLDSFIVEDNDEEGMDSLTASPYMLDHHHIIHAKELERQQLQHSHDENHPSPHSHSAGGGGGHFPSSSSQTGQQQLHQQPQLIIPSTVEQPVYRKEIIARKPLFSRKHLKYYKQYSEKPISFIDMLLYQAMTIDQWSSSSTTGVPLAEAVFSPKLQSPEEERNKEPSPKAFFSFVLANNPSHNH